MKKTILTLSLAIICVCAMAQGRQQAKSNSSMMVYQMTETRSDIILPEVNGYKVIKADLHVHTSFSDAAVTPDYRVKEAWIDGLDVLAITDHIEYRPHDKQFAEYLEVSLPETKKGEVKVDLNVPVKIAQKEAKKYGLTIIPGVEITRSATKIGHFCCLFTTDNNLIPDADALQAIRNAKKQGALVQSNHPGWRCKSNEFTPVAKAAIAEGLLDGVEVFNGSEFYPDVIEEAVKNGLYVAGNTDIHQPTKNLHDTFGHYRDMTFIMAKDASLESVREALEAKRTLAYSYGDIAGEESLLKDFFAASVELKSVYKDSKGRNYYKLSNKSSLPYMVTLPGANVDLPLAPMSTIGFRTKAKLVKIGVKNMWMGPDRHPEVEFDTTK